MTPTGADKAIKAGKPVCEGCYQARPLKDGFCPSCTLEASIVRDCPGEAVSASKLMDRFWDEENLEFARAYLEIATTLAQRVADRAKVLELAGPARREIVALIKAARYLREAETQLKLAGMSQKAERPTMLDSVVPEVGMRVFAERRGSPEPAKICSLVGNMYDEAWVAFEDGERARRRVDKLLKWTAPEEPCTCTNEESDRADCAGCLARTTNERYDANRQRT